MCREAAGERPLRFHQSNFEDQIVDWIHEAIDEGAGIIINPAGFTFTSIADPRCAEDVSRPDHRAPHLQHPPARGNLSSFAMSRRSRPRSSPASAPRGYAARGPRAGDGMIGGQADEDLDRHRLDQRRPRARSSRRSRRPASTASRSSRTIFWPSTARRARSARMVRDHGPGDHAVPAVPRFRGPARAAAVARLRPRRAQIRRDAGARHRPDAGLLQRLAASRSAASTAPPPISASSASGRQGAACASATRRSPGAGTSTTTAMPGRSCAGPTIPMSA